MSLWKLSSPSKVCMLLKHVICCSQVHIGWQHWWMEKALVNIRVDMDETGRRHSLTGTLQP